MDEFIKICAVALVAAVLILLLRRETPAIALVLGVAGVGIVLFTAAGAVRDVTVFLVKAGRAANVSQEFIAPLIKIVAVSIICRITCDVCRDAGQNALATGVEIAGAAAAFYIGLPILSAVLELIIKLI